MSTRRTCWGPRSSCWSRSAVAVILYDAGILLDLRKLHGHTLRVVVRLIAIGVPVTLAFAAVFAGLLLGMSSKAALMLGAILVASGPTVVGPLLVFIRPTSGCSGSCRGKGH